MGLYMIYPLVLKTWLENAPLTSISYPSCKPPYYDGISGKPCLIPRGYDAFWGANIQSETKQPKSLHHHLGSPMKVWNIDNK